MHTERVTYLTNAEQKAALEAFAKARGESVGNVLREAAARYMAQPTEEEEAELAELAAVIEEVAKAAPDMQATLRRTREKIEASIEEVDRKLREAGLRE